MFQKGQKVSTLNTCKYVRYNRDFVTFVISNVSVSGIK